MKRICDVCGAEQNEWLMQPINSGRKTEWWCWDCYLNSQHEAAASDMFRRKKLSKMNNARKRNK